MAPIEQQVGAHEATTERILEIVTYLASSTIPAPRELSKDLRDRLEDIANHHAGTVPLHGRLFAQWLHHAYPRECPYPHETGSKSPMTADEWLQEKQTTVSSSRNDIKEYVQQADAYDNSKPASALAPNDAPKLPWSPAEKLVAQHVHKKQQSPSWVRKLAFAIASVSGLISMFHTVSGSLASVFQGMKHGSSLLPYVKKQHAC